MAAPLGEVTMPMRRGSAAAARLRAGVEEALGLQPRLQLLERQLQRAEPLRLQHLEDQLVLAALGVDLERPNARTCSPSAGSKRIRRARLRKSTARTWASSSFSVK